MTLDDIMKIFGRGQQRPSPTFPSGGGPVPLGGVQPVITDAPAYTESAPKPSLREGLLGRLRDRLLPTNPAMAGLLSPEEIAAARKRGMMGIGASLLESSGWTEGQAPTLGQAIGRAMGAGREAMSGGIAETLQTTKLAKEQQQQESIQRNRARIAAKFPPVAGETKQQQAQRFRAMFAEFVNAGDTEMITKLSEVVKSLDDTVPYRAVETEDLGDRVRFHNPNTGQVWYEDKGTPPKAATTGKMDPTEVAARTEKNRIFDDFQSATRAQQAAARGYGVLRGSILSSNKNPASPIAMLYAYARLLDPESVVREGEIATLQKMGAVDDRVRIWFERARTGVLPQDFVAHVKEVADDILEEYRTTFEEHRRVAQQRGVDAGLDVGSILPDPFKSYPKKGTAPARSGQEPPKYK